jgi:aminomethyltransferase
MPVWFTSIEREHLAVRNNAGVFDISHMKRTYIDGSHASAYLDYLCGARISSLRLGQLAYTHVLNERGGIIDDGIVYRLGENRFLFVTNACTAQRMPTWMTTVAERGGFHVNLDGGGSGEAMIALQGPRSLDILKTATGLDARGLGKFESTVHGGLLVSRSGYTGEDGVEIVGQKDGVTRIFEELLGAGAEPCGLGSRDTLRLEMGYPLACVDFNEDTTPLEMGAQRFLDFTKEFIGRAPLLDAKPKRVLRGVLTEDRVVLRGGYTVEYGGDQSTTLTSGTLSPILNRGIGLAFFPLELTVGTKVKVDVRGTKYLANVVKPPFIKR